MKAKICFLVLLALTLNILIFYDRHISAQEPKPSLIETFDWLKGKSEYISGVSSEVTRDSYKYSRYMEQARSWELADYNGCTLTWRSKEKNVYENNRNYDLQMTATISFADINPTKIQTESVAGMLDSAQFYSIRLFTTDEKKLVRWQFFVKETTTDSNSLKAKITGNPSKKTKESLETFNSSSFEITVAGEQMGQRFTKAIQNAVGLCGGKLDKKEPF